MFFIGIFGVDTKDEEVHVIESISCPTCHQTTTMTLYKHYQVFHFFFIPIFKWNTTYYVACSHCQNISLITKEKGERIETGECLELTYWDLDSIPNENGPELPQFKKCSQCEQWINEDYQFCPRCGKNQAEHS